MMWAEIDKFTDCSKYLLVFLRFAFFQVLDWTRSAHGSTLSNLYGEKFLAKIRETFNKPGTAHSGAAPTAQNFH